VVDTSKDCWSYLFRTCPCCFCTCSFWACMITDGVWDVCTFPFMLLPLQVLSAVVVGKSMLT
jgi:hypothetical protein